MQIININNSYHYETENLLRVFFPTEKYVSAETPDENGDYCVIALDGNNVRVEVKLSDDRLIKEESFSLSLKAKALGLGLPCMYGGAYCQGLNVGTTEVNGV